MSRNIYEAIKTDKLEEVTIRLNLGEDIDQSFPPRLEPLAVLCRDNISYYVVRYKVRDSSPRRCEAP